MAEEMSPQQRLELMEHAVVTLSQAIEEIAWCVAANSVRIHQLEHATNTNTCEEAAPSEALTDNPVASVPESGYLDVEAFVTGKCGTVNMPLSNQFGQIIARAGQARGIEPKKITHPGQFWEQVNTWPIEFLREMWAMTYGNLN